MALLWHSVPEVSCCLTSETPHASHLDDGGDGYREERGGELIGRTSRRCGTSGFATPRP